MESPHRRRAGEVNRAHPPLGVSGSAGAKSHRADIENKGEEPDS